MTDEPTITVSEGGLELPVVDVLTGRGALFGKSGSGKSNSVGVIAEELLEQGFPLVIIDADGEHYGLKEEYELLHVGATAEECDAAITPESAEALARLTLDQDIAVILDISEFASDDAKELVHAFIDTLFEKEKKLKKPLPVFIEEAHEYIPETRHPDDTAEALIRIAKRGRKRGLGLTAISQRPANVNKDVVTQVDWSVWHKLWYPNDTKVVRDVIGPEAAEAVQELDVGEAIVMADWLDDVRTVKFKRKQTFDAGATPGLEEWARPELKSVSADIIEQLESVTEAEAEREDRLAQLETTVAQKNEQIAALEEEIKQLREERPPGEADPEEVKRLREAVNRHKEAREQAEDALDALDSDLEAERAAREDLEAEVAALQDAQDTLEEVRDELRIALATAGGELPDVEAVEGEAQERVDELEAELEGLRQENERLRETEGVITIPTEYNEFYEHEVVDGAIKAAANAGKASDRAVWGMILTIADMAGPVTYEDVADRVGYADNSQVSRAATELENRRVVKVVDKNPKRLDFNFDGMAEIERKNKIRDEMERRIEQKTG